MMDAWSNRDSGLNGKGIIESEGLFLKVSPVSPKDKDTYLPKIAVLSGNIRW